MIRAECHTVDNAMALEFDATPWFTEADAETIVLLAGQGWSSPWIADALQHPSDWKNQIAALQPV